jgi:hypothetical protein
MRSVWQAFLSKTQLLRSLGRGILICQWNASRRPQVRRALPVGPLQSISQAEFAALGVARMSLGSFLASSVQNRLIEDANALQTMGDDTVCTPIGYDVVDDLLAKGQK